METLKFPAHGNMMDEVKDFIFVMSVHVGLCQRGRKPRRVRSIGLHKGILTERNTMFPDLSFK